VEITDLLSQEWRPSDLLLLSKGIKSRAEAKRLIKQGAVCLRDNRGATPVKVQEDTLVTIRDGTILQVGKRFWWKFRFPRFVAEVYEFTSEDDERTFLESCPHISPADRERTLKDDWQ